jgi:uncharacterized protein YndB with AHSA1/START domain
VAEVRYSESIEIAVPPEVVYDYRLDFTTLPDYNPNVSNLRRVDHGIDPGPGADYLFDLTLPGAPPMENPLRVVEATRPSRIVFDTGPGFMASENCTFAPVGAGGTAVEFAYTISFPGDIDDETRSLIENSGREQARLELENMKKILEG